MKSPINAAMLFLALAVLLSNCTSSSGDACMVELAYKLDHGQVEQLEIYRATSTLTPVALSPEDVEKSYYKTHVTKRQIPTWSGRKELVEALKATSCEKTRQVNHRWALVFLGRGGVRLGAVYLDESGDRGTVNSRTVAFHGPLGRVISREFGSAGQ